MGVEILPTPRGHARRVLSPNRDKYSAVFLRIQHLLALNTFSKGDKGAIVRLSTADLNPFDRDRKGSNINRARAQG